MAAAAMAQVPKAVTQAKKAVFSVITYDNNDKIIGSGNGFFISPKGDGVSDYTLFKGATKAVVVDADGKQHTVDCILGANEMYDVVKFRIKAEKNVSAITLETTAAAKGATLYLLPYSTQKQATPQSAQVSEVSDIDNGDKYYTLALSTTDKMVNCPVVNDKGNAVGMIQKGSSEKESKSYALGASYVARLSMTALSSNDYALNSIGIKKGFPSQEDQALVYLYMLSGSISAEEYLQRLDDFLAEFPNSADGYFRRASANISLYKDEAHYATAEKDIEKALSLTKQKDNMLYDLSKVYLEAAFSGFSYKDWNTDKAIATIKEAIAINPSPIYVQQQGEILFVMEKYEEAYDCFNMVNQSEIKSETSLSHAAKCKEKLGQREEALSLMDSTLNFLGSPLPVKAAAYLLQRAAIKTSLKMYRQAVADYNQYEKLLNGRVGAAFYLLREQNELEIRMNQQALDDIKKAVELEPRNPDYLMELTSLHIKFNQLNEALEAAKRGIEVDPDNVHFYRMLGYCQVQTGAKAEGKANLLKAKEKGDPNAESIIEKYCK